MTPTLLRQLWALVEATQTTILLGLDDTSLVQWLLRQFKDGQRLDGDETTILNGYIRSKLPLIRDLAHERTGMLS